MAAMLRRPPCVCDSCCEYFPERRKVRTAMHKAMRRDPVMASREPKEKQRKKEGQ
jgi:hypothetical protein